MSVVIVLDFVLNTYKRPFLSLYPHLYPYPHPHPHPSITHYTGSGQPHNPKIRTPLPDGADATNNHGRGQAEVAGDGALRCV